MSYLSPQMNGKILVIDDDPIVAETIEILFDSEITVISAKNARDGIELAKTEQPDLILLDVRMPEMDGYETCRRLRSRAATGRLPIVMITAMDSEDCRQKGLDAGADAYFTKPFDPDQVISTLAVLIGANDQ